MYVYVKGGKIRMQSEDRIKAPGFQEYKTDHKITDRLIFEEGQIKRYEQSKQYAEDTNRYHLMKELAEEQRKNKELITIANTKVKKDMELDKKGEQVSEYHRKLYLLRNMKGSQHS